MKSIVLKTEFKNTESERVKWRHYMRERRKKIKLGIVNPTPFSLKTKTKNKHYQRDYQRKAREMVIKYYGGVCECCKEKHIQFLAIDHIHGGGRKHRKIVGTNICLWIIKNNFPDGFRVLCHNCNMSIGFWGICPHKKVENLKKNKQ